MLIFIHCHKYTLNLYNIMQEIVPQGQEVCLSSFLGFEMVNGMPPTWILGDTFLRAYYTVFDVAGVRLGFARSH